MFQCRFPVDVVAKRCITDNEIHVVQIRVANLQFEDLKYYIFEAFRNLVTSRIDRVVIRDTSSEIHTIIHVREINKIVCAQFIAQVALRNCCKIRIKSKKNYGSLLLVFGSFRIHLIALFFHCSCQTPNVMEWFIIGDTLMLRNLVILPCIARKSEM